MPVWHRSEPSGSVARYGQMDVVHVSLFSLSPTAEAYLWRRCKDCIGDKDRQVQCSKCRDARC
jgi:hypothetical protein